MLEYGARKLKFMKKKIYQKDENRPVGKIKIVKDTLPSPEYFAKLLKTQKITMEIDKTTLDFYKLSAKKFGGEYLTLISNVLYNKH